MTLFRLALLMIVSASVSMNCMADKPIIAEGLIVTPINAIDVASRESGVLKTLSVTEGDRVNKGEVIGEVDAEIVEVQAELARVDLEISKRRADMPFATELAKIDRAIAKQTLQKQQVVADIAKSKGQNDVRILASEKATEIAKNELARASIARDKFPDSVSKSELESLRLTVQRNELETKQAKIDQRTDQLKAESEDKEIQLHQIGIDRSTVQIQQATSERELLDIESDAKRLALRLAQLMVARHRIVSPISGIIVERYQNAGQWVEPGTVIVRVLHMDRLQAQGFFAAAVASKLKKGHKVFLRVPNPSDSQPQKTIPAIVSFVSPEVDPVNGQVRVLIQFDNHDESVLPGMKVDLVADRDAEANGDSN